LKKKIYHAPEYHAAYSLNLSNAEIRLGHKSTCIGSNHKYFNNNIRGTFTLSKKSFVSSMERILLVKKLNKNADIIHFNYGSSLIDPPWRHHFLLDLPIYKSSIKKVMTFQGSDVRMKYDEAIATSREYEIMLGNKLTDSTKDGVITEGEVQRKLEKISKISKYTDRSFALNPDLLENIPNGRFLPYPAPLIFKTPKPDYFQGNRPLKIVHMATNRVLKGTGLIESALKELSKNYEIDYDIIVKKSHTVASKALDWADVLIDQVCLGWYGGQAVEALIRGKPVLCYLRDDYRKTHMPKEETGIISITHQTIGQEIAKIIDNPEKYKDLSIAGLSFVKSFHNPEKIVKTLYENWI